MNMGLIRGPDKDSNSTLHSLVVQGGNSRDGEGLEDCALELDPRTSTDEGSLKELQVIDCSSGRVRRRDVDICRWHDGGEN